jgi:beta-glucosidase
MSQRRNFPDDFLWGAATSAYQIEGAVTQDGRGRSIWDTFAANPDHIDDGRSGAMACDHYNRWREDVGLMSEIGLQSYRFSIAWPRIFPDGHGRPNQAGIDWYSRLVDGLLEAGIQPAATLYHWDLPQVLEDRGGWPDRATIGPFLEYTNVMTHALGDRVKLWMTHNEPSVAAWLGYLEGVHAPGRESWPDSLAAMHHMLLSHGRAVPVIRSNVGGAKVGPALQMVPAQAASSSAADLRATAFFDLMWNRWYHDPIAGKGYPMQFVEMLVEQGALQSTDLDFVEPGDMKTIAEPNDFIGVNYYSRGVMRSQAVAEEDNAPREVILEDEHTDMGWEVHPPSFTRGLKWLAEQYPGVDRYVMENGAAYATAPDSDGVVRDEKRRSYLDGHLRAALDAIEAGVPLRGYFAWSFLDNFEWAHGMTKRFGLVWVDYESLERTLKESARWYGDVIRHNGLTNSPLGKS